MIKKTSETRALAGNIVNAYSKSQKSTYSCDYLNGKLLWANPNPTSSFAPQTITLNSDDYDVYEVFYKVESSSSSIKSEKSIKGYGCWLEQSRAESSGGSTCRMRNITYTNATTLVVDIGWSSTGTSNRTQLDSSLIPIYIIGYKTGLFN